VDIVNLTEAINVLISEKCLRNRKDRQRERERGGGEEEKKEEEKEKEENVDNKQFNYNRITIFPLIEFIKKNQ